ncbi:MAG: hypothetical protein HYV41_04320 [Candidatus Magasanikbacteria bacterium]|nr:hypothetical protein [Candidatus Magasanikbacteria bacterium]
MADIAIDIVLRLPQKLEEKIIARNIKNFEAGKTKIKLGKTDYIPHISLLMGVIDEKDIGNIAKQMQKISKQHNALTLSFDDEKDDSLSLTKSKQLLDLHKQLINELQKYLIDITVQDKMFVRNKQEQIPDEHKIYVKNFRTEHSLNLFKPHITTYARVPHNIDLNQKIIPTTLSIYQLGYSCTCRKLLCETELKNHS